MKFTLSTTGYFYPNEEDRLKLQEIGFEFEHSDYLKFKRSNKQLEIEINSLEELISFSNKFGAVIINDSSIEIYNDYRE
jgi:hypothetical protein